MKSSPRGFSLIELLVVIAIIGVFSAIVLASLSVARSRANDTAIKANLATIRIQAEVFSSSAIGQYANTYGSSSMVGKCVLVQGGGPANNSLFKDPTIANALTAVSNISGPTVGQMYCYSALAPKPAYVVAAKLSDGTYWCIDSTGFSGVYSGDPSLFQNNIRCS
ncbi:type II secretion system GspH family protein [Patescibacteria group bacterium]|nr:type II secretion system GspH family protein [Patescibacteria group bacterium]